MLNYDIDLNLSELINTEVCEREVGDSLEEGIFIPFAPNGIYRKKTGTIAIPLKAIEKRANAFNQSHYISIRVSKKKYDALKKMGYNIPILGNMSLMGYSKLASRKREKTNVDDALNIDE